MKSVGERIRLVRTNKGMTLEELAKRANISKSFLWAVENGKSDISGVNLLHIANALGASVDYLLKGGGCNAVKTNAPIEIPAELSHAAEDLHLSFREAHALLQAHQDILARRGGKEPDVRMTAEAWKKFWDGIKDFIADKPK